MKIGKTRTLNLTIWTLQILLAALFLFAGAFKLRMPVEALAEQTGLPGAFMRFIGVAEVTGGLGLLLPGLVRIHRELTPLAAGGLAVIMAGAVVVSVLRISAGAAAMPLVVGSLLLLIARTRRSWSMSIS